MKDILKFFFYLITAVGAFMLIILLLPLLIIFFFIMLIVGMLFGNSVRFSSLKNTVAQRKNGDDKSSRNGVPGLNPDGSIDVECKVIDSGQDD